MSRPTLAVWKFASCDGCQLSLLDCEDELLAVADAVEIAYFAEATSSQADGPYDVSLVEGSITTDHDAERIRRIRDDSGLLVAIGSCATLGGVQALRNRLDLELVQSTVYPEPSWLDVRPTSTPISDHVAVDLELPGCPIDRGQLLEVVASILAGRPARLPTTSVCVECKARGVPCVMVASGTACLGPATRGGCGALCPAHHRGCYGCFGPAESPNLVALTQQARAFGLDDTDLDRWLNGPAPFDRIGDGKARP